jgi:hypothetical protein
MPPLVNSPLHSEKAQGIKFMKFQRFWKCSTNGSFGMKNQEFTKDYYADKKILFIQEKCKTEVAIKEPLE